MYKQGDKVKVKTWEELLATPGVRMTALGLRNDSTGDYVSGLMREYCGQIVTITRFDDGGFQIEEDKGAWSWFTWMLTPVEEAMETAAEIMADKSPSMGEVAQRLAYRLNLLQYAATLDRVSVGMWVFDTHNGWTKITELLELREMVIVTDCGRRTYADGRNLKSDKYPSLFLVDIFEGTSPPAQEIDWSKVPMDTEVEVRNSTDEIWLPRHFCCYLPVGNGYGQYVAFVDNFCRIQAFAVDRYRFCRLVDQKPEWIKC